MSKSNQSPAPVPPENQPRGGHEEPHRDESGFTEAPQSPAGGDQEQDEKRRLGGFTGKGDPARRQ